MKVEAKAEALGKAARAAARDLSRAGTEQKNQALLLTADLLLKRKASIMAANKKDLAAGKKIGLSAAMLDRLAITPPRLVLMAEGLRQVAALPDPVGATIDGRRLPNGLNLRKVRVPLGVIYMIFESRPNVTIDAGSLGLKSGNAVILRGGKEAIHSNIILGKTFREAIRKAGLNPECIQVLDNPDRTLATALMHQGDSIDVVIPRGGKGLIEAVMRESVIPVIAHLDGICHVYVDEHAAPEMAESIVVNAKTHRTGVCNAMETLLIHKKVARSLLPKILGALKKKKVTFVGCEKSQRLAKGTRMSKATAETWSTEYLDLKCSVKVVDDLESAIAHINHYGSQHTDAIVTNDVRTAERFRNEVDSSSVMVNASTRFSDGFEYGLGAEMGISTNKLHARGPVGLEELTTYKYLVDGTGHIRS
ncbi:MAG: glutamate-5-semialdehyde dehydrogenase [Planctomycetota bacterium]|jgi:glutamate-5-semialdehyde dehydrogenase